GGFGHNPVVQVQSCHDPEHIPVHSSKQIIEGNALHGSPDIRPDAFEAEKGIGIVWYRRIICTLHLFHCGMEIAYPVIIAETFPVLQQTSLIRISQSVKIRVISYEFFKIGYNINNLGLLEHDFTEPDVVRIARPPPWQVSFICLVPCE